MQEKNEDRRTRKTKAVLQQSLIALLREKNLQDISVTELTQLADVNRGTFYSHYQSIFDLAAQMEHEMFLEFKAVMDAYPSAALRGGIEPILRAIFRFISKNADLCAVLLTGEVENAFLRRLKEDVYRRVMEEWGGLYGLDALPQTDYYMSFLVDGFIGLLRAWERGGRREGPEEMARLAGRLIEYGLQPSRL
ncbi:hypothetical protein SDC9_92997 [bioreactor metagenome]|uniref:HTH tetR-type domain-containing protein n=1 Tax=bioreactor metagenome TaxID=1076179 RepID=A0A644ZZA4_9ZZZZ